MGKQFINSLVGNMKKAGIVTKVSPWLFEQGAQVRYVGLRMSDWSELFAPSNNLLLRVAIQDKHDFLEILLANKPPFVSLVRVRLRTGDKWELLLGELKRRLNKDKQEYQSGSYQIDNLYKRIVLALKK